MCSSRYGSIHSWLRVAIVTINLLWSVSAQALITSEMSVELRGTWYQSWLGSSNYGLFLEVNIPFDPKRPSAVHGALLQDEQTTPVDEIPLDPLERDNLDGANDENQSSPWGESVVGGVAFEPIELDHQFVADLIVAALVAQGCDAAWSRLESLGSRNRASALLPEVSLRAGREQDTALRLTPTDTDPYNYTQSNGGYVLLEGRLAWRLGRLLFSPEDLGLERLKLARARERQRVTDRLLTVLLQWMRAQSMLRSPGKAPRRVVAAARWGLVQATLRLDSMTAGWFSAHRPDISGAITRQPAGDPIAAPRAVDAADAPPASVPTPPRPKKAESAGSQQGPK